MFVFFCEYGVNKKKYINNNNNNNRVFIFISQLKWNMIWVSNIKNEMINKTKTKKRSRKNSNESYHMEQF